MVQKSLLIQGATGSIGRSTLAIVREQQSSFSIAGLSAKTNVDGLLALATEFGSKSVAIEDEAKYPALRDGARSLGIKRVYAGRAACAEQAAATDYDLLVNALMGVAGLEPTVVALGRGINVALANKETLVAAGPLVLAIAQESGAQVLPIDSEHSAIFQCLLGESRENMRKIYLTTSGGPFWGRAWNSLGDVSPAQALAHPTWKMGPKITVDSATMFNKGLEVIEAERLFGVGVGQISVLVHRQSVVHSMVEFCDGSFKAQLSVPDMRLPILFAVSYPDRVHSSAVQTDWNKQVSLTFEPLASGTFPCLDLAYDALEQGGTAPAALSAADEVAVDSFLAGRIPLTEIPEVIAGVISAWPDETLDSLDTVRKADTRARQMAVEIIRQRIGNKVATAC